jgi:serine/threonine-protein kinase
MADAAESRLSAALADRYRIERELGQGGMATVYLAEDLKHRRRVAIKVLLPDLAAVIGPERFLREIETTANLRHPHILPLYDSGEAAGFLYYVMPYVEGESLRDRLDREKQLPLEDALRIAREVADALSYAHGRGIVHRDVKPENILLEAGHAVVADFGIAKAVSAAGGQAITQTGMAVGTPQYMSPEQAAGEKDLDGRSDLYALACVLYEMLAGQPPFTGPTVESVVHQHLAAEPRAITTIRPAVPAPVAAALQRALAKSPADRFNPVAQFSDAISALPAVAATPPGTARRALRWAVPAAGVVVAVALVIASPWRADRAAGGDRSIAVLPFDNLSSDTANAFFAAGMHEEVLTTLARVRDIRVIARSSVEQFAQRRVGAREVARELGVAYVMEGSVRRAEGRVRVSVRLVDGRSEQQVWSDSYDRDLADVFAIQTTIAREIAQALEARLSPEERQRLGERPTASIEAYDLFLRAQAAGRREGIRVGGDDARVRLMERAVAVDTGFALAYAVLGAMRMEAYWFSTARTPERLAAARADIERALALRPGLPEAHFALASYYYRGFYDYPRALEQLEEARRALPGSAEVLHLLGLTLRRLGRYEESVDAFGEAVRRDPANLNSKAEWFLTSVQAELWGRARAISARLAADHPRNATFAAHRARLLLLADGDTAGAWRALAGVDTVNEFYAVVTRYETALFRRDFAGAIAEIRRHGEVPDITVPGYGDLLLAEGLLLSGDRAAGRVVLDRAVHRLEAERGKPYAATYVWPHVIAAVAHALAGDSARAREACDRRLDILPESRDKVHGVETSRECARVLGLIGDTDGALAELERLLRIPYGYTRWELALDPRWDFFRRDARFRALATPPAP